METIKIYVNTSTYMSISFDTKNINKTLTFSGETISENTFLAQNPLNLQHPDSNVLIAYPDKIIQAKAFEKKTRETYNAFISSNKTSTHFKTLIQI